MPLTFAPENGHMLGGTMVNLTGPCFEPDMRVTCRFNTKDSEGVVLNENRYLWRGCNLRGRVVAPSVFIFNFG